MTTRSPARKRHLLLESPRPLASSAGHRVRTGTGFSGNGALRLQGHEALPVAGPGCVSAESSPGQFGPQTRDTVPGFALGVGAFPAVQAQAGHSTLCPAVSAALRSSVPRSLWESASNWRTHGPPAFQGVRRFCPLTATSLPLPHSSGIPIGVNSQPLIPVS